MGQFPRRGVVPINISDRSPRASVAFEGELGAFVEQPVYLNRRVGDRPQAFARDIASTRISARVPTALGRALRACERSPFSRPSR
jgi:hypothetical protein